MSKRNYIGTTYGGLTITKQYSVKNKNGTIIMVDYKCKCGNITTNKIIGSVKRQKMCLACRNKNQFKILPNGETSFNLLYTSYIRSAKNRLLDFKLDNENFRKLTNQDCFYCGVKPRTIIRPKSISGGYVYNGIDRKDSNIGYTMENCVPCCKICNYFKLKLSVEDFLNHIKKIYENHFKK